jgi:hypothetical protein
MPGAARQPWSEQRLIRLVRAPGLSPELVLLLGKMLCSSRPSSTYRGAAEAHVKL